MFAHKSRLAAGLVVLAGLAFSSVANAHPGGGTGHGGAGHGGAGHGSAGHGHSWHHGWGGWSWNVPWDWSGWTYPTYWDDGNTAAWQQGYYSALQQAQWAAIQQQAELTQRKGQQQVVKPSAKRQVTDRTQRPAPVFEVTIEERAAGKLKLAMLLADAGKTADAAEFWGDIVKTYPSTAAAEKARQFLDKVNK